MIDDFRQYLLNTCKCRPEGKFLLAVSGGIDSTVMTHLFKIHNFSFSLAHCNFGLRGQESEDDQHFVEEMAAKMGVQCHVVRFSTTEYANEKGISIQMAARDLRYAWFNKIAGNLGLDYVATAHNENDVVETVLLNFSRGTGIRGMMGIRPAREKLIRPLLFASRSMIESFAREQKIVWRNDSSNDQVKYHRNKLRLEIIPALEAINPAFISSASSTINRLEKAGKLLDFLLDNIAMGVVQKKVNRILIHKDKLRTYPAYDLILFELLRDYGISHLSEGTLAELINAESGRQLHTPTHTITSDREHLIVTKRTQPVHESFIIESAGTQISCPLNLTLEFITRDENFKIPIKKNVAALDARKVKLPLILRKWKEGDKFQPLGMKGTKKISDYLIDCKVPLPDKEHIRVIESEGKIMWLVNYRLDDRFKITSETSQILLIKYEEEVNFF